MRPLSMGTPDQAPASAPDPATPVESADLSVEFSAPSASKEWDSAHEQAWSEHSATAWALAHVIHRIRSTPLPPTLLPEQRRRFHKVVQMAAALIEEWQRSERDQAQQLAADRPLTDSLLAALPANESHPENLADKPPAWQEAPPLQRSATEETLSEQETDAANQNYSI